MRVSVPERMISRNLTALLSRSIRFFPTPCTIPKTIGVRCNFQARGFPFQHTSAAVDWYIEDDWLVLHLVEEGAASSIDEHCGGRLFDPPSLMNMPTAMVARLHSLQQLAAEGLVADVATGENPIQQLKRWPMRHHDIGIARNCRPGSFGIGIVSQIKGHSSARDPRLEG